MRLILFNGPPRSGKDTAVRLLAKNEKELNLGMVRHISMAEPLKNACHAFVNDRPMKDEDKDKPMPFTDKTWRQWYIHMSEQCAKPFFGSHIFGWLAAEKMVNPQHTYVVSDVGFHEEVEPLVRKVGGRNTLLVTLSRPSCSFANDSRNYLQVDRLEQLTGSRVSQAIIDNRHDLEMYEAELVMRVRQWRDKL